MCGYNINMTKIIQDLYVTELNISNVSNAPFIINAVGTYPNQFTVNEEILNSWNIEPNNTIIGKNLILTLESVDIKDAQTNYLQIDHLEKTIRRRYRYLPDPSFIEEIEFILTCSSPRMSSEPNPCPNYKIKLSIKESEYSDLYALSAATVFNINCHLK